ncbi:MAG: hypothetical protein CMF45_04800 [Legionellales bacterium]|nr:hypothetical protein [Legionellales bacterium]
MEERRLEYTPRVATKANFLRSINRRKPPTKWNRGGTKAQRRQLTQDFVNLQATLKAEAISKIPKASQAIFTKQTKLFEKKALELGHRFRTARKANADDPWTEEEIAIAILIMADAAKFAFGNPTALSTMARPTFQSLIDKSYTRTRFLLGEADGLSNPRLAGRNERILKKLKRVQISTLAMANFKIKQTFDDAAWFRIGYSWGEAVGIVGQAIQTRVAAPSRVLTIARTEGQRAVDEGLKEGIKLSDIVSHMSVIGCQAVEPNIPTYRGDPTCNIEDVPVEDVDLVDFHINHTGAWVASRFRDEARGVSGVIV